MAALDASQLAEVKEGFELLLRVNNAGHLNRGAGAGVKLPVHYGGVASRSQGVRLAYMELQSAPFLSPLIPSRLTHKLGYPEMEKSTEESQIIANRVATQCLAAALISSKTIDAADYIDRLEAMKIADINIENDEVFKLVIQSFIDDAKRVKG